MEVLNLISGHFWGWFFPCISRIHTAYIGFRTSILGTLKCSIPAPTKNRWWFPAINRLIQKKKLPSMKQGKVGCPCDECHFFVGVVWKKKHVTLKKGSKWCCSPRLIFLDPITDPWDKNGIFIIFIYLYLVDFKGKWRSIYRTWILWGVYIVGTWTSLTLSSWHVRWCFRLTGLAVVVNCVVLCSKWQLGIKIWWNLRSRDKNGL